MCVLMLMIESCGQETEDVFGVDAICRVEFFVLLGDIIKVIRTRPNERQTMPMMGGVKLSNEVEKQKDE